MIEKIKEALNTHDVFSTTDAVAKTILETIEKNGMEPPFSYDVYYKSYHESHGGYMNGNEWDKE